MRELIVSSWNSMILWTGLGSSCQQSMTEAPPMIANRATIAMRSKCTLLSFVLIFCLAFAAWSGESSPAVTLPAKEQFHIYLLFGQSNMAGRGQLEEGRPAHPRVLKLTAEHTWAPATEPLHFDLPKICGAGIGTTFGEDIADANPAVTIGLVPCA